MQIRQEVLTDGRVFGRPIPEPERVFLAVGGDAECHDQTVIADVHPVEDQADEVQTIERRRLSGR